MRDKQLGYLVLCDAHGKVGGKDCIYGVFNRIFVSRFISPSNQGEIVEHLQSPQFTDAEGQVTGQGRIPFLGAGGRPRWLGYLFYVSVLLMGVLALRAVRAVSGRTTRQLLAPAALYMVAFAGVRLALPETFPAKAI